MLRAGLATLSLSFLFTGCPSTTPIGNGGDPPTVTVSLPSPNHVGQRFPVSISVSGCEAVDKVSLYDGTVPLRDVQLAGSPTVIELEPTEVPWSDGIAATVNFVARARCDDGRIGDSLSTEGRFFPTEVRLSTGTGAQFVPDQFEADGTGTGVTFVGCSQGEGGLRSLVRVDHSGQVIARNDTLPFACNEQSVITPRHPLTGKRWLWQPPSGVPGAVSGAFAFGDDLVHSGEIKAAGGGVTHFGVGPDGDGVAYFHTGTSASLVRVRHDASEQLRWSFNPGQATSDNVAIAGNPYVGTDGAVLLPLWLQGGVGGGNNGEIAIEKLDYATGNIGRLGQVPGDLRRLRNISFGLGGGPIVPSVTFSPDGRIAYFPDQSAPGSTFVWACSTDTAPCDNAVVEGSRHWRGPALSGNVLLALPYAQGSRLAAVAPDHVHFLDAATGQPVTPGDDPIDPTGSLVVKGVQPGAGRDFFILTGPNVDGAAPLEIIGVDAAEHGELFRHQLVSGSLWVGVDGSGGSWLRVGPDLHRLHPLREYRLAVTN